MEKAIIALLSGLLGVIVGAGGNHFFWTVEERQREERARKEKKERVAERLGQTGGELIELARSPLGGPNIDQTHLTTVTYIELLRLKREFLNAVASARDAFPLQQDRLKVFQRQMDAAVLNQSKDRLDFLRAELDILLGELTNPR